MAPLTLRGARPQAHNDVVFVLGFFWTGVRAAEGSPGLTHGLEKMDDEPSDTLTNSPWDVVKLSQSVPNFVESGQVSLSSADLISILDKDVLQWMGGDAFDCRCFHPPGAQSNAFFRCSNEARVVGPRQGAGESFGIQKESWFDEQWPRCAATDILIL